MTQVICISDQKELVPTSSFQYGQWSFSHFNPVQSRLLQYVEGTSNIAVAACTASGKTVCAEMFMAYEIRKHQRKALYIAPMKSLAREKERDWQKPGHHFADLKVSICTGDYRFTHSRIDEIDQADILVLTPEMLSSLCRNHKSKKSKFLQEVGLICFDEAHLLTVPSRGDHIEIALMKMTEIQPECRLVLLSATMPNVDEVCGWICNLTNRDTHYLESSYRPCPLGIHYEVYYDGDKRYEDKEREKAATAVGLVNYYSKDKWLIFVHTKRTGQLVLDHLKRYGIDGEFHNADLPSKQREGLEDRFKTDPQFRVLVATSTVAWGVNTPSRRVCIVGVDRGLQPVEHYDIEQECGRAGRPAYDSRGDAYILVPESKKQETIARLKRKVPIRSQLLEDIAGHHKTLAFHVVSEIHHGNIKTREAFHHWFRKSLAHHQNHNFDDTVIDGVIALLVKNRAISVENEEYKTTSIGTVASMFYYSPFDVADLRKNFKELFDCHRERDDFALSMSLADIDSHRYGIVNKVERAEMMKYRQRIEQVFGTNHYSEGALKIGFAYYNLLNGVENSTYAALQSGLRLDGDRTLEVLHAIDSMSAKWGVADYFNTMRSRLTYGVKPELVQLVQIPHVGRVRSEKLYEAGIRTLDDFVAQDETSLAKLMNIKADKVKESLEAARKLKVSEMLVV